MIGILDYGLGNIRAFSNIYKSLDIPYTLVKEKKQLENIDKLILPGVGAFDDAMIKFQQSGLCDKVEKMVLENNIPILGICVGLQILGISSDEGEKGGLGWINAQVKIFDSNRIEFDTKLPHMGWNSIKVINENEPLFKNLKSEDRFYFLHSYYFECKKDKDIIAVSHYGSDFTCAVKSKNIYGVQFHPEKSLKNGERLLYNFAKI
jgi:glutamine amidotransferase